MVKHLLGLALAVATGFPNPASAEVRQGDLTLTVTPELNGGKQPFSREMVLLRIRGVYRQQILLEELVQPSLANFSWTQLGRDHWGRTKLLDGQNALVLDRVIAVFPHHAGNFTVESFVHRLTINDDGERRMVDVRSEPIALPVVSWTAPTGGPDVAEPWWLPAKDVAITDSWSPDPETLKVGESARRIVTVEAQGLVAEGLPPRPVMRTRGILTFAGPVTRETIVTPAGPVARTTYQWDVRPAIDEIIPLDAIVIPWFDTTSRTMREAEIPARQIGGGLPDLETSGPSSNTSPAAVLATGCAAFGIGLALIGFGSGRNRIRLTRGSRRTLAEAARTGDGKAFRVVIESTKQTQPNLWICWMKQSEIANRIAELDGALYAPRSASTVDLTAFARALSRSVKPVAVERMDMDALWPLDGQSSSSAIRVVSKVGNTSFTTR